jgi:uncharacterized protein (TIGR02284 family)
MAKSTPTAVLNELIQTSQDGRKGFAEAAERVHNPALKTLFSDRAAECARAAVELQELVSALGGEPEHGGTVAGAMHRGWVKVKSAVTDPDQAALEEVERGEDHAKAVYAKALKADLSGPMRAVVEKQYQGVLRNHDRVRNLRDSQRAAA